MACAWTGVGVTNSFLARFFRNAEQRLSSEKYCITVVGLPLSNGNVVSFQDSSVRKIPETQSAAFVGQPGDHTARHQLILRSRRTRRFTREVSEHSCSGTWRQSDVPCQTPRRSFRISLCGTQPASRRTLVLDVPWPPTGFYSTATDVDCLITAKVLVSESLNKFILLRRALVS